MDNPPQSHVVPSGRDARAPGNRAKSTLIAVPDPDGDARLRGARSQ